MTTNAATTGLRLGWAQADLTPERPVAIVGQFHVRVSEGVMDPITATVLALDVAGTQVVFVSCDLVGLPEELRAAVCRRLPPEVAPGAVIMHGTHTHTGPEVRLPNPAYGFTSCGDGVDLPIMPTQEYLDFASARIAQAIAQAWQQRAPGRIAYGLGHAVVGRNRRWVNVAGGATMYGNTNTPEFSHIEGYEDHSVNVLATYNLAGALTGVVVNVPCPSQVDEGLFVLSADYWHDTRQELRRRLGPGLFVLAQCSAAGDQSPHPLYEEPALARMWQLAGRSQRQVIAQRITDAVTATLDVVRPTATDAVTLQHRAEHLDLPLAQATEEQIRAALAEADACGARYEAERQKLERSPELRQQPRWYVPLTEAFRRRAWLQGVAARAKAQGPSAKRPVDLHFVRLGDVAFATNPFEYYLDFGVYIKCRSKAVQTFLVQLAGGGTYVPSPRSVAGGGYGSIPASNPVGPAGGRQLAERSVAIINELFTPA